MLITNICFTARTIDAKGCYIKIGESKQGLNIFHLVSDQNYIFGLQNVRFALRSSLTVALAFLAPRSKLLFTPFLNM